MMPVTQWPRWLYLGEEKIGSFVHNVIALFWSWGYQIVKYFLFTDFAKGSIATRLVMVAACAALATGVVRLFAREPGTRYFCFLWL